MKSAESSDASAQKMLIEARGLTPSSFAGSQCARTLSTRMRVVADFVAFFKWFTSRAKWPGRPVGLNSYSTKPHTTDAGRQKVLFRQQGFW